MFRWTLRNAGADYTCYPARYRILSPGLVWYKVLVRSQNKKLCNHRFHKIADSAGSLKPATKKMGPKRGGIYIRI